MIIKRRAMGYLFIPLCYFLLSACSGGGGSDPAVDPAVDPASSNWDQMVWDQDDWS